jgi:hypothetical protein
MPQKLKNDERFPKLLPEVIRKRKVLLTCSTNYKTCHNLDAIQLSESAQQGGGIILLVLSKMRFLKVA